MLLYISILGILLSVILFSFTARLYRSSVYLAGFFFLTSLYSLNIYILFYSKSEFLVSFTLIYNNFSIFLHGPLFYWYIRSTLTDNPRLRRRDAWHLLPAAIFFLFTLPYIFTPTAEKLKIASELVKDISNILISKPSVLYNIIPAPVVFLGQTLHALIYIFVSIWMLGSYLKTGKKKYIISSQQVMLKWLILLLGFILILAFSQSFLLIEALVTKDSGLFYSLNFLRITLAIGLVGLMISPLFFPSILYGLPVIPATPPEWHHEPGPKGDNPPEIQKVKSAIFEEAYLMQIGKIIESCMSEMKPYLQKDFNLTILCALTKIPVHHLAYYFREHLGQSFHDYRNTWRVEHVKKMIREGKTKGLTLEGIGQLSGFSSRNTFFIAFKRIEGVSPSEYAKGSGDIS
ncbi:MAG: helix-turn-helix domain-containing protein [Bacteroidales bacterium]